MQICDSKYGGSPNEGELHVFTTSNKNRLAAQDWCFPLRVFGYD